MKYFKIKVGYGENEYVPIDEDELETALFVFLTEGKGIFKNGVVRGKDIIGITEDWHKAMGWNKGYELSADDWIDIKEKGVQAEYQGLIGEKKEKIQYLIQTNQQNLIGKNVEVIGFENKKQLSRGGGIKSIREIMK